MRPKAPFFPISPASSVKASGRRNTSNPYVTFQNSVTSPSELQSPHRLRPRVHRVELYVSTGTISLDPISLRKTFTLAYVKLG
ncbi:uncharacterized protein DS421_18g611930 [Arachis hypogaea]|nr:uncharacterized protein DS421_18g611930 [Arachis hypogaea]